MVDRKVSFTKVEKILTNGNRAMQSKQKNRTLDDAIIGADVFLGLSAKGTLTKNMVKKNGKGSNNFCLCKSRSRNNT